MEKFCRTKKTWIHWMPTIVKHTFALPPKLKCWLLDLANFSKTPFEAPFWKRSGCLDGRNSCSRKNTRKLLSQNIFLRSYSNQATSQGYEEHVYKTTLDKKAKTKSKIESRYLVGSADKNNNKTKLIQQTRVMGLIVVNYYREYCFYYQPVRQTNYSRVVIKQC